MSVLSKFKTIIETVEEFPKEKAQITLADNSRADIEGYNLIKLFEDDKAVVSFDEFEICISGEALTVEYFSPTRLVITGCIRTISYMCDSIHSEEVL